MLPKHIEKTIYSVVEETTENSEVTSIYLFGSYYSGKYHEDSDIDLAFFVKDGTDLLSMHRKINKITSKYPVDIQPQIFYESELQEKNGIVGEIIESGGEIRINRVTEQLIDGRNSS